MGIVDKKRMLKKECVNEVKWKEERADDDFRPHHSVRVVDGGVDVWLLHGVRVVDGGVDVWLLHGKRVVDVWMGASQFRNAQFRQRTIPPSLVSILYLFFGSRWFSIL